MDMDNKAALTLFDLNGTESQRQGKQLFVAANLASSIRSQFDSKIYFSFSLDSAK